MLLDKLPLCVAAHHRQLGRRLSGFGCRLLGLSMLSVPVIESGQKTAAPRPRLRLRRPW